MRSLVAFIKKESFNGKITNKDFWRHLLKYKTTKIKVAAFRSTEGFSTWMKKKSHLYQRIIAIPIYCEDRSSPKKNKIELAMEIKEICRKYKNSQIYHSPRIGRILGNKLMTNLYLASKGVRCPKVIVSREHMGQIFVNEKSASHAKTKVLNSGKKINQKKYNTEFIDTYFEYNGEGYYASIRTMCVEGIITDIYLRFRNSKENNPNVHNTNTPLDADLQNFYYDTKIKPNLKQLEDLCSKVGNLLKLGFYAHDILLCNKTSQFYLIEVGFKFDNTATWKNYISGKLKPNTPNILHLIKHEKPTKRYIKDSIKIFYELVESKYL